MSRFYFCFLLATITVSVATHTARASDESVTAEIVDTLRSQTDAKDARATLERISSSIEYRDIYQMLGAGLNENTEYPIPNALVDRIMAQFSNVQEGDMDAIADYLVRFDNDRFDRFDGFLTFLQHPGIEATGLFKIVTSMAQHRDSVGALKKEPLIDAIYSTELYQSEDKLSDSFRQDIFTNLTFFFMGKDGELDEQLSELFFTHISDGDDALLADVVTGLHKDTIRYNDVQRALETIVPMENCSKRCQGTIIQLVTYNEDVNLSDRDAILMSIVEREGTSDYILGDVTTACWDARIPLTQPEVLLAAVQAAKEYGPEAKLKVEQARRNMSP